MNKWLSGKKDLCCFDADGANQIICTLWNPSSAFVFSKGRKEKDFGEVWEWPVTSHCIDSTKSTFLQVDKPTYRMWFEKELLAHRSYFPWSIEAKIPLMLFLKNLLVVDAFHFQGRITCYLGLVYLIGQLSQRWDQGSKVKAHKMGTFFFWGIAKKWFIIWGPGRTHCSVRKKSRQERTGGHRTPGER